MNIPRDMRALSSELHDALVRLTSAGSYQMADKRLALQAQALAERKLIRLAPQHDSTVVVRITDSGRAALGAGR